MDELDLVPVKDLWTQYGVGRTFFYNTALSDLRITPKAIGRNSFITSADKRQLDSYFTKSTKEERQQFVRELFGDESGGELSHTPNEIVQPLAVSGAEPHIQQALYLFADAMNKLVSRNPLEIASSNAMSFVQKQLELKKAAEENILLPTRELKNYLGVNPPSTGKSFTRGSFRFSKIIDEKGQTLKIGSQTAWKVEKIEV